MYSLQTLTYTGTCKEKTLETWFPLGGGQKEIGRKIIKEGFRFICNVLTFCKGCAPSSFLPNSHILIHSSIHPSMQPSIQLIHPSSLHLPTHPFRLPLPGPLCQIVEITEANRSQVSWKENQAPGDRKYLTLKGTERENLGKCLAAVPALEAV